MREKILLSSGPQDNPNSFKTTYKTSHAIAAVTPPKSTIFMPYFFRALEHTEKNHPENYGTLSSLVIFAALDVLYPRRVYWGIGEGVKPKKVFPLGKLYQVTYPYWLDNQCKDHPEGKPLGYYEWFICPTSLEVMEKLYSHGEPDL